VTRGFRIASRPRVRALFSLVCFAFACGGSSEPVSYVARPAPGTRTPHAPPAEITAVHTDKVCQIIGDIDRELGTPVANRTPNVGIVGTDLGVPVAWRGDLVFMFGDTTTAPGVVRPESSDPFARIALDSSPRALCSDLSFETAPDHAFDPITLDGRTLPGNQVVTGAFPGHHHLFAFFTVADADGRTIGDRGGRGVLAKSDGDNHFRTVRPVSESNDRFDMVAPALAGTNVEGIPRSWRDHDLVALYGTGRYRESFVRLALMQRNHVEVPWIYWAGVDAAGAPIWSSDEASARPLSPDVPNDACVGEMSVAWSPHLARWIMAYNCHARIQIRTARAPWGPWSAPRSILDAGRDAWGRWVHHPCVGDGFRCGDEDYSPQVGAAQTGALYGPYLIPEWFESEAPGEETIYFTLSTWNPYVSVLMSSTLEL